jgi:hypothetical protein
MGAREAKCLSLPALLNRLKSTLPFPAGTAVQYPIPRDFVPAVQAAKEAGVLVHLFHSDQAFHYELRDACDDRTLISEELIDKCRF